MKTRYDTKATGHQFKEGDKVWFYNPTRRKGLSPKLQSHWDGPYTILKIINDVVIRILIVESRLPAKVSKTWSRHRLFIEYPEDRALEKAVENLVTSLRHEVEGGEHRILAENGFESRAKRMESQK
ncbi:retrovirus-related Pol polyprotein from transposon 412 [Trichonephila clavipes]|nr:retrovirus-related Pol polyprotein from transposon 412 [Trichonephila clavipes]